MRSKIHIVNLTIDESYFDSEEFWYKISQKDKEEIRANRIRLGWFRESMQRNNLAIGFEELGGMDHDLILMSDADEIADPACVRYAIQNHNFSEFRTYTFGSIWIYHYHLGCRTVTYSPLNSFPYFFWCFAISK